MKSLKIGLLLSLFLLSACASQQASSEVVASEGTASATAEQPKEETKQESIEDQLTTIIQKTAGKEAKSSDNKQRVVKVSLIDDAVAGEGFKIVTADLNADEHRTVARTRDEMLLSAAKLFPALYEASGISEVSINWHLPLTDNAGNDSDKTVMTITLRKDKFDEIDWKKFDVYSFEKVANRYYEHKALQK